jgi:hypothetical protein
MLVAGALVAVGSPRAGAALLLISMIPLGIGDLFERYLFFAAMATPTMPGGLALEGVGHDASDASRNHPSPGASA